MQLASLTVELGFEGLRMFGSTLISHVALKVRKELNLQGVMMVDSPGMIDSPTSYSLGEMTREVAQIVASVGP